MARLFALVDGNNFFAACERVFRPDLEGRPVVVLSNNDGCIVARSREAKALGISMGVPYFKVRGLLRAHGVHVFSSNYELYGDLSARVMAVLAQFSPGLEVYSIDEAFLNLDGFDPRHVEAHVRNLRAQVKRWTGIPVSIGVAATKTLAKLAVEQAKADVNLRGVLVLEDRAHIEAALMRTPVGDVWGIGRRWSARLNAMGVESAGDFIQQPERWVRERMGVGGVRTRSELLGCACFDLKSRPKAPQSCVASRSFARPLTELDDLKGAIATFAARARERLCRSGGEAMVAGRVRVFIHTDRFDSRAVQYNGTGTVVLPVQTNLSADITRAALAALTQAYRPGFRYKRAGVALLDLSPESETQASFFAPPVSHSDKAKRLQRALDALNGAGYGEGDVVCLGPGGLRKNWHTRRDRRSPRYTTQWAELCTLKG